jgi:Ca-activated chloride channel family protein
MLLKKIRALIICLSLGFSAQVLAAEDADELYRQGRFAEAEKAYAASDMDHPKDLRYRYNRGCAAYQNSDYQGAMGAFSSVMRRAKDDKTRFKAAYNLGNTAFKNGDFSSAVAHYKQAILYNPEREEARHNLELALIGVEKSKKEEKEDKEQHPDKDSSQSDDQKDKKKEDKKEESSDKKSREKDADQEQSQTGEQNQEKDQQESDQKRESEQKKNSRADEGRKAEQESERDLSGELEPRQALPEEKGDDQTSDSDMSMIDKKKAEALLDNIKEDRSRILRFLIPEEKRRGVSSGKDW